MKKRKNILILGVIILILGILGTGFIFRDVATDDLALKWSSVGPIEDMTCLKVDEPIFPSVYEPAVDDYLCYKKDKSQYQADKIENNKDSAKNKGRFEKSDNDPPEEVVFLFV